MTRLVSRSVLLTPLASETTGNPPACPMTWYFGIHPLDFTVCNHFISLIGSICDLPFYVGFLLRFQSQDLPCLPFTPSSTKVHLNRGISTKVQILYFSFHVNISIWMFYWHHKFNRSIIKWSFLQATKKTNKSVLFTSVSFSWLCCYLSYHSLYPTRSPSDFWTFLSMPYHQSVWFLLLKSLYSILFPFT